MDASTQTPSALQAAIRQSAFRHGQERRAQRWLAEACGIHESDISRIVKGMDPGEDRARAIAAALGETCTAIGFPQYEPVDGAKAAA